MCSVSGIALNEFRESWAFASTLTTCHSRVFFRCLDTAAGKFWRAAVVPKCRCQWWHLSPELVRSWKLKPSKQVGSSGWAQIAWWQWGEWRNRQEGICFSWQVPIALRKKLAKVPEPALFTTFSSGGLWMQYSALSDGRGPSLLCGTQRLGAPPSPPPQQCQGHVASTRRAARWQWFRSWAFIRE